MKVLVEQISEGQTKSGVKNGRTWEGTAFGIKVNGTWYNQMLFDKGQIARIKESVGNEIELELYDEQYVKDGENKVAKRFKFPNRMQMLEDRLANIEARLVCLEDNLLPNGGSDKEPDDFDVDGPPDDDSPF